MVKEEFFTLAEHVSDPAITIYMPTHTSGKEVNEKYDQIIFKNILQAINAQLGNKGFNEQQIGNLLAPAFELLKEEEFWLSLNKGLAVFLAPKFFEVKKVPISFKEEFHINSSFHLAPLVPLFSDRKHFYLLVLSKNASSFYKGDQYGMERLSIEGLPQGVNDVIHFEEKSERKLFRGGGNAPGAEASFHGHGSGLADDKEYISQYLKEVDQTLRTECLANENAPLLLASVEYIVGIYKQISHYKYIVNESLNGNLEHADITQLFNKALEIVHPYLKEASKKALKNYYNQLTTPLTSSMPEKVIPATYFKQVYDLFVEKDAHIWGKFDEVENKLLIHEQKQPEDECLVNKAIVKTLENGGSVYLLEKERMPNGALIAASLRF